MIFKVVYQDHLTQLLPFAWDFVAKGQRLVWGQVGSHGSFAGFSPDLVMDMYYHGGKRVSVLISFICLPTVAETCRHLHQPGPRTTPQCALRLRHRAADESADQQPGPADATVNTAAPADATSVITIAGNRGAIGHQASAASFITSPASAYTAPTQHPS